jgi:hypothetical protein
MTMGEPSENLQYFLELQKQRSKKKMSLFKGKKMFRPPLLSNFISSSFLFILKFLKAMEAPF